MKKFYLSLVCMGIFSATLLSQSTYVTGNAKVKVQPNTLFYHGGDFTVKEAASDPSVILNSGNIKINGSFVNEVPEGKNFVSTYTNTEDYGQVIINDDVATALNADQNRLTMVKQSINPSDFTWGQFAIPYFFDTVEDAHDILFPGADFVGGGNRYLHSIMTWDNITRPEYDHIATGVAIKPTDYVILNLVSGSPLESHMESGDISLEYSGRPSNGVHTVPYRPAMYQDVPWNTWKTKRNIYGEQYQTYIEEHLRLDSDTNFGKYYFQFGNPYTSNIDLSRIGTNEASGDGVYVENLYGVVKVTGMQWTSAGVDVPNVGELRATYTGDANAGTWAGDPEALIVKPFEPFYIVLRDNANRADRTFTFNDGLKTFSNVPLADQGVGMGDLKTSNAEMPEETISEDKLFLDGSLSHISNSTRKSFYQLGLSLYSENEIKTGNTVYVVVDSNSHSGIAQPLEAEYTDFQRGFFLTQETTDGSEVNIPNRVMQINTVHPKYVSKPIPLFFKTSESDVNGYYLKADLYFQSIFNKLKLEDSNYVDGNSFFFYDKAQDLLLPITTDFSYYIERPEEIQSSRYVIYWNGGPVLNKGKMEVSDELAGNTQIYKDGEVHKIRFNEYWSTADVSVYDLAGRAVFKDDNIKTDVDYVLDLPKTMVYVVKIQSNTGETVTQKIVR